MKKTKKAPAKGMTKGWATRTNWYAKAASKGGKVNKSGIKG